MKKQVKQSFWAKLSNVQKFAAAIVAVALMITTSAAALGLIRGWTVDALGEPPYSNQQQTQEVFTDITQEINDVSFVVATLQQEGILRALREKQFQILQLEDEQSRMGKKFPRWKRDLMRKLDDERRDLQETLDRIEQEERPVVRQQRRYIPRRRMPPNSPVERPRRRQRR